jgi:UDP-N-acetylmuramoyl-tripeptide--D-alanyl-D-alanine ligase
MIIDEFAGLVVSLLLAVAATIFVGLKWLRVAQREHYIAGWVTRLASLWYSRMPINVLFLGLTATAIVATFFFPLIAPIAIIGAGLLPWGLRVRGTSSPLKWTGRAMRLAIVFVLTMGIVGGGLVVTIGVGALAITVLLAPLIMDLVLVPMAAVEKRLSNKYLVSAQKRLGQVRPIIVAITGSYGKTSTKNYATHVLNGSYAAVGSPASFNNLMGLSRAVNERVVPGTEVFVAEMGVYGVGEIRELSKSFPPDIAAITTIGEAHLARMRTRETITRAKSEIVERAATVVLPIDQPELAALAEKCRWDRKRVITVSTIPGTAADVVVDTAADTMTITDKEFAVHVPDAGHGVNIAVSAGIALALDVAPATIADRLRDLPASPHRAEVQHTSGGVVIIDDTYNSNPVGSRRALETAAEIAAKQGGQLVVVTPGMVELGSVQFERNAAFATSVVRAGGKLIVVGRTNRRALMSGAAFGTDGAAASVQVFDRRQPAVAAAVDLAGARGVLLYENDLPDHYP